jgi:hypothetical protein
MNDEMVSGLGFSVIDANNKLNVMMRPRTPIGEIVFLICWLVRAILGGALLAYIWGLLAAKYETRHAHGTRSN